MRHRNATSTDGRFHSLGVLTDASHPAASCLAWLDGPLINDTFVHSVAELPHITHPALIEPRWNYSPDGTEIAAFLHLLQAGQSFQRVLLTYYNGDDLHLNSLRRSRAVLKLKGLREGLDVFYNDQVRKGTGSDETHQGLPARALARSDPDVYTLGYL